MFTFAISSPDEFLLLYCITVTSHAIVALI